MIPAPERHRDDALPGYLIHPITEAEEGDGDSKKTKEGTRHMLPTRATPVPPRDARKHSISKWDFHSNG
jgi:hypothetical protein